METDKIVLTLNNEEEKPEEKVEVAPAENVVVDEETQQRFSYDALTDEEKKMVEDFSKQIDVTQTMAILQYGSAAQNKVADFSDNTLRKVKTNDLGDIGSMLTDLVKELNSFNTDEEVTGIRKLFHKAENKVTDMRARYDTAAVNVDKIAKTLEDHQITLMKDINMLDQLYDKNLTNFKELSMYILAGYKALDEVKSTQLPELLAHAKETGLPEDAQKVNDLNDAINRFEKRLHDLELTRMVSIQMAPQIRLVQNNDTLMIEKIQSTLANTIPLWKSQMLIAMGLAHSQEALKAESAVTEMTNMMLKKNAENLKMATVETAKQAERGIVDIETLTETNKKLIETLDEVKKIQDDGKAKRAEALVELRRMENELNDRLTNVSNNLKN